ncbi:MAG: hypothetical protein SW833_07475 [Cyanobacteriota bacterium]|nr:hypothetical protein [Cyanobacteriota bacterium]
MKWKINYATFSLIGTDARSRFPNPAIARYNIQHWKADRQLMTATTNPSTQPKRDMMGGVREC